MKKEVWQRFNDKLNRRSDLDFYRLDIESFAACPSDSIDYAIMEKTSCGVIIALESDWNDLLENPGKIPLELIEIQSGRYLREDDIERMDDIYGRSE
ncbi:hypothetical protein [Desulfobacterium sp. N47]|uniref:hypothetical protein n=1 Tax=Desulfobacterium sp. N47 TaxID=3115210 RepID=UPI003F49F538